MSVRLPMYGYYLEIVETWGKSRGGKIGKQCPVAAIVYASKKEIPRYLETVGKNYFTRTPIKSEKVSLVIFQKSHIAKLTRGIQFNSARSPIVK